MQTLKQWCPNLAKAVPLKRNLFFIRLFATTGKMKAGLERRAPCKRRIREQLFGTK